MLPFHSEAMKEKGSGRWRDGPTVPTSIAHTNSLQGRGNRLHEEGFVRLLYLLLVSLTYVLQKQCDVGGQGSIHTGTELSVALQQSVIPLHYFYGQDSG